MNPTLFGTQQALQQGLSTDAVGMLILGLPIAISILFIVPVIIMIWNLFKAVALDNTPPHQVESVYWDKNQPVKYVDNSTIRYRGVSMDDYIK